MKNNISNEYLGSPSTSSKPYERKIKINQVTPKNYFTNNNLSNFEQDSKETPQTVDENIQSQNNPINTKEKIKIYNFTEEFRKNQTEYSDNFQNNFEYNSQDNNLRTGDYGIGPDSQKQNFTDINNIGNENTSSQNPNEIRYKKDYQIKYLGEVNTNENNNDYPNYNYKYKYKKFQKDERDIEYDDKEKEEGEYEEEQTEEDKEKIDLQELKKKPGKLLHQSVKETYDDEGNRIITTKTIKEFSQNTPGFRIKNIQQIKEKKEYERHTTNNIINKIQKYKERKSNFSYKNRFNNNNKGDRIYLIAQLAKIKNESEKKKKNKIYSASISPIIIHESNGYENENENENQNSILSHEMINPNSFDKEIYERDNYNYNNYYQTNYGRINLNNETEYDDRYYYPNVPLRLNNIDDIQDNENENFIENESAYYKRNAPSPIGYIATYSSGSEDNEEIIDRSYDQYRNRFNYTYHTTNHSKDKNSKNKNKKEGELVKQREIIYQMESPDEIINNKKFQNLSGLEIKAHMETSKSDKKDFQSPDRLGPGSDKFRKVTMAMISSLGPTCEDRKITRKMRIEVGGVVDLRHELNPVNNYKIKKVKRVGFNLNKEVNPKTKIENARIIQYWWRNLKEIKIMKIKYLKIVKIQAVIRGFLTRNRKIKSANIYSGLELIEIFLYKRFGKEFFELLKNKNKEKLISKLARIINKIERKGINQKLIKYFFKYKFIANLLSKQNNYFEEKIETKTKITEEMYVNYIKEKYLKSYISQHTNDLSIKESKEKKNTNEQGTGIFSLNEGIDKMNINYIKNKKEYKDSETVPIESNYELTRNNEFNIIDLRPELKIDKKEEYNILKIQKDFREQETQKNPELKEQGINPIKIENQIIKNNDIKLIHKKKETSISPKKICKNEKIAFIHKINKIDKGQQMDTYKNIIKKNESINIISNKPKIKNAIKRSESFKIINLKKKYKDELIQYTPEKNSIYNQTFEIIRDKPETKDNYSQYIPAKTKICKSNSYSVIRPQKKIIKYTIRKNNFSIVKKRKIMKEKGEQCEIEKKHTNNEIRIGNKIERNIIIKIYEIIEKIWKRKNLKKFINNSKSKIKDKTMKREIMRMALLKWRFIKGYGGDRYGNIYDRNGKKIGEKEGEIKDISIQNTLGDEIDNELLRKKNQQVKVSKQKPIYIKSKTKINKKKTVETGTGDGPNHILNEKVVKIMNLAYKRKPKSMNRISGKNYFKITKKEKDYKNQGTSMLPILNKIVNENRIFINNENIRNEQIRKRDLLLRIVSKSIIREKYKLNDCFSNWYKKTIRIIEQERKKKLLINKPKIIKNEKFEIINKIEKKDKSCGNVYIPNKIDRTSKFELRQKKLKKDEGILISFPSMFNIENLKKSKINSDIYKSKKNPIILRKINIEGTTILGSNIRRLTKEEMIEITKKRKEILFKIITTRITPESLLRKYFTTWCRIAHYKSLIINSEIISKFCKKKFNQIMVNKRWRKLYQKYILKQRQYNIMKIIKKIKTRKEEIFKLIRITTLIRFYSYRTFLHKIMMSWLLYSINANKKRNQMKLLYKNMLTTYVNMADDIFGKDQKNNPSIQDFMFEIVDTNKYQVKQLEDVPIAQTYYSKKKEERKVITSIKYIYKDIEEEKKSITVHKERNNYYPKDYRDNIKINKRLNFTDAKNENLSNKINLSFNYNDSSIFENNSTLKTNSNNKQNNIKNYGFKDYSQTNNTIIYNNNYTLDNSPHRNNNYISNNSFYKYRKGDTSYSNNSNNDYNKININNNKYSNIKRDFNNNVIYEGLYDRNKNNINYSDNKDLRYNKYSSLNYNNININLNKDYNKYNYKYKEKTKSNNIDLNNNKMNSSFKIKPEEKSKYISNYYRRRNINNNDGSI